MIHCEQSAASEHQQVSSSPDYYKQHRMHQLTTLSSSLSSSPSSLSTSSSSSSCTSSTSSTSSSVIIAPVQEHNIISEAKIHYQQIDHRLLVDCQPNELIVEHDHLDHHSLRHQHHYDHKQQSSASIYKGSLQQASYHQQNQDCQSHNQYHNHQQQHLKQLQLGCNQEEKSSDAMKMNHLDSLMGATSTHNYEHLTSMFDEEINNTNNHHYQNQNQSENQDQTSRELYEDGCQQERQRPQHSQHDWIGQNHHQQIQHHQHQHHRPLIEEPDASDRQIEFALEESYKQQANLQLNNAQIRLDSIDESVNARFGPDADQRATVASGSPKSTKGAGDTSMLVASERHHYLSSTIKPNDPNQPSLSDYNNNSQQHQHQEQQQRSHLQTTTYASLMPSLADMAPEQRQTIGDNNSLAEEADFDLFQCNQNQLQYGDEMSSKIVMTADSNNNRDNAGENSNSNGNRDNYKLSNQYHQHRHYTQEYSRGSTNGNDNNNNNNKQEVIQNSSPNEPIVSSSSAPALATSSSLPSSSSSSLSSLSSLASASPPSSSSSLTRSHLAINANEQHQSRQLSPLISATTTAAAKVSSTRATSKQNQVPTIQYQFYSSTTPQQQQRQRQHEHQPHHEQQHTQSLFNLSANYVDIRTISSSQQQQQQSFQDPYYNNYNSNNNNSHCDQQQQQQMCNNYYGLDVHKDHLGKSQDDQQCQYHLGSDNLSYLERVPDALNNNSSSQYRSNYHYGDNHHQDHQQPHHQDHLHLQQQQGAASLPYQVPSNVDGTEGYYSNHVTSNMNTITDTTTTTATSTPALGACNKQDDQLSTIPSGGGASLSNNNYAASGTGCNNASGNVGGLKVAQSIALTKETLIVRSSRPRGLRGRPRKKKGNAKGKVSGKLWEFIRDLLLNECTNPSFIRWERREDGVFKFVQSDKVAKMWGERKQNPKMTYEKLSRAMRYYYKSKVLLPVFGRRLVYKFGPNATGWMSSQQHQQHQLQLQQQQQQHQQDQASQQNQNQNQHEHHEHNHYPSQQQQQAVAISSTELAQIGDSLETSHHQEPAWH